MNLKDLVNLKLETTPVERNETNMGQPIGHVPFGASATKLSNSDRQQAMELIVSFSKDIVGMWPNISFRTLRSLNDKIQGLKEALEMLDK